MKKLTLLLAVLLLSQGLFAQFYYDHAKSNRLELLALTIAHNGLEVSGDLSLEADKALKRLAEETKTNVVFADYLKDSTTFFIRILSEEETNRDILDALEDMTTVWTNEGEYSLVTACETKKNVGASYVDIYDPYDDRTFGVFVILFR